MRALGMIPIDRDNPALAKRTLDEAAAKLGKTVSVVIFPEGTRAPAGQMLPFKGGAFVFAIEQQVPVVPVALHNTAQVMPAHGYLTILGGRVVVEILDPIPTAGLTFEDRHRLKEQVHEALVQALRPEDGGVADRRDLAPSPSRLCRAAPRTRRPRRAARPHGAEERRVHEAERHGDRCRIVGDDARIDVCTTRADHDLGPRGRGGRRRSTRATRTVSTCRDSSSRRRYGRPVGGGSDRRRRGRCAGRAIALLPGRSRAGGAVRAAKRSRS